MKKLFLAVAMTFGAMTMAACTAPVDSDGSQSEEATQGLRITEESDTVIVGDFASGENVVSFEARLEAPIVRSKLVVNGATYEFAVNVVDSKLDIDGHANTILAADAEVLRRLEKAFDKAGSPSKIREAMFRTIALMSAAPRGTTILHKSITPAAAPSELERGYCDNDDGITYLCGCNTIPSGCSNTYMGVGGPDGKNPLYKAGGVVSSQGSDTGSYGGYVSGCTSTPTYTHEHEVCEYSRDSSYHGRVTWAARCGWSASQCEGRCGAGCPNSYNFYLTKDCLDHDVCLNNHPGASATSTFGDCGNEFDRASGDFAYGTGASFASLCGSWMIGETTR